MSNLCGSGLYLICVSLGRKKWPMTLSWLEKLSLAMNYLHSSLLEQPIENWPQCFVTWELMWLAIVPGNIQMSQLLNYWGVWGGGPTGELVFLYVTYFFCCFYFQGGPLTISTQEAVKHTDLFSSSSPVDKGTKSRTKTVLSLFDEEEDKTEDQNSIQAPKKDVGKVSKKQWSY